MEKERIVCLGGIELEGGKLGTLYIPARVLLDNPQEDYEVLRRVASTYGDKPTRPVGGVYDVTAELEGDRIKRMGKNMDWQFVIQHPALVTFEAATEALARKARRVAAEKKAKATGLLDPHIEALAQQVAKVNRSSGASGYELVQAFAALIQQRANQIARGR